MAKIAGGCLCGSIRYESDAAPIGPAICHCSHCQKQSGTAYSLLFGVPRDSLKIAGDTLKMYEDSGESGEQVWRYFCANCGSPIYSDVALAPQMLFIKAGTLDDISQIEPQAEFWTDHKHTWLHFGTELPGSPRNPGA